jgi:hypothetical protein
VTSHNRTLSVRLAAGALLIFGAVALPSAAADVMPRDHRDLKRTISYAEMETFLKSVDGKGPLRVSVEGKSLQGRSLYVANLKRGQKPSRTILFYAQQHGDEISGKDALLYLIRDLVEKPSLLPPDVDLWIMPMVNPDGAEAGTRANAAKADLNRDHMTLLQPETLALHQLVRRIRPDISVDCHEFGRGGEAYRKKGWEKWPDITLDSLNNPLFDRARIDAGERWIRTAAKAQRESGHPFLRYWVGGVPPDDEQRHSAPDLDSGLNALAAYGGLSFIIEAAARRGEDAIAKELGNRVDAYLVLFRHFIRGNGHAASDAAAIRQARQRPLPEFIPVNYFWANPGGTVTPFPVVETATGRVVEIPTANMMTTLVVKKSVPAPAAYAIDAGAAAEFAALLDRHGIPYERLASPRTLRAEKCTLLRVEDDFDEIYSRYEGRQIVERAPAEAIELPAGSILVGLNGEAAHRAALLLEPSSLYGLYQYPLFRALVGSDGTVPVLRVPN